ncbi:copper chaperone PCu(A)C [Amycolatopsis suaedae]|uniref:Copper chaperone PCu(A)C n=1 Tax=Amycolatopsis suaedae TaxID=2510978 RepID=A0A4Q7J1Y1_9PSEU|nr:copper chaperone PCu(A)C [Amycolatopsis suaedae]RZQ61430.1 copper chaperone PCu(A)C [Amycolatopsis suaedae]
MRVRRTVLMLAAFLVPVAGCGPSRGDGNAGTLGTSAEIGEVKLRNVYVERPDDGAHRPGDSARVAFTVVSSENADDRLTAVTTGHAREVRINWDQHCDGTAEPVTALPLRNGGVPGPADRAVTGHLPYHLTLVGFTREVLAGTTVPLTFTFARAGTVTVDAMVQPRDPSDAPGAYACGATPL